MRFRASQLHGQYQRLTIAQAQLHDQLAGLKVRRADEPKRAARTSDGSQRALLARRVAALDRQTRLLEARRTVVRRQMRLVEVLIYATEQREIARQLEGSATTIGAGWLDVLGMADGNHRPLHRRLAHVDDLLAWLKGLSGALPKPARGPAVEWATVKRVPDGDGARLEDGRRVRYLGIDAPETDYFGRTERYAEEAKALNHRLVVGKRVRLERDQSDTDPYDRLLRYVWVGDTFVNAELVQKGVAYALPVPPDTRHEALLSSLEEAAHHAGRGLWASKGEPQRQNARQRSWLGR